MPHFATTYVYTDDSEGRDRLRPEHRAYLAGLDELAVSAPFADEPAGALLVFEAADADAVRTLLDADPFVKAGFVSDITIREWNPVLGPLAQHF